MRFGKAVIGAWTKQLRSLPENADVHRFLGLPGEVIRVSSMRLSPGPCATRSRKSRLIASLEGAEAQTSTTRNRLADQQVGIALMVISEYVNWLGFSAKPLSERPQVDGSVGFRAEAAAGRPAVLDEASAMFTAGYILSWFEAFKDTAINNAGHAAGSEISPEQNDRLGQILRLISGGAPVTQTELWEPDHAGTHRTSSTMPNSVPVTRSARSPACRVSNPPMDCRSASSAIRTAAISVPTGPGARARLGFRWGRAGRKEALIW